MSLSEDVAKLNADVPIFLAAGQAVKADLEALVTDMELMKQTGLLQGVKTDLEKIDLRNLLCFSITVWNLIAPILQLPSVPVPAFCTTKK
jgi:hypothetical protein